MKRPFVDPVTSDRPAHRAYYVPAGTSQLEISNDPAVCWLAHADGYLASIIDAENGQTTFTTDARGFVTSVVDPLGNVGGERRVRTSGLSPMTPWAA